MTIDRDNKMYVAELRYRADGYIDDAVCHFLKNGGRFEAKEAARLVLSCLEFARLATDVLAANGLLPPEKEGETP